MTAALGGTALGVRRQCNRLEIMSYLDRLSASINHSVATARFEPLEARQLLSGATPFKVGSTPWVPYALLIHQDEAAINYPYLTGAGQTIAEVDRGIDYRASVLGGGFGSGFKIATGYNFRDLSKNTLDDFGHGTGVAGILAAEPYTTNDIFTGVTEKGQGLAPGAKIASLKQEGSDQIKAAMDWVILYHHKLNIQVLNLTDFVTNVPNGVYHPSVYASELKTLHDLNIFVSTPVGNGEVQFGPNAPISLPATSPYVFGAGGVNQDDTIWNDSLRGFGLDLLGPSHNVTMPYYVKNPNANGYNQYDDNYTGSTSIVNYALGTSWASAHVSGTAALLKQVDPTLTPDQISQILTQSGDPVADPENPGTFYPRLNVNAAIGLAYTTAEDPISNQYHNTRNRRAAPLVFKKGSIVKSGLKLLIGRPDAYSFTVPDTRTLNVSVQYAGESPFPSVTVYNPAGKVMGTVGSKGASFAFSPGTYYLYLESPASLIGSYGLTIATVVGKAAKATPQAVSATNYTPPTQTSASNGSNDVLHPKKYESVFAG